MRMHIDLSDHSVRHPRLLVVLVLVLAFLPAACGSDDDLAMATDLMEQWSKGWNDNDPDALADLITDDAVLTYEGVHYRRYVGREKIRAMAEQACEDVQDVEVLGPVTMTDDGAFTYEVQWHFEPYDFVSEVVFEVEDDLISRIVSNDEFAE